MKGFFQKQKKKLKGILVKKLEDSEARRAELEARLAELEAQQATGDKKRGSNEKEK